MMKVYICPECGWLRAVSRRKEVECFKCGNKQMTLAKITYEQFTELDDEQRRDYADSWMYIHKKSSK